MWDERCRLALILCLLACLFSKYLSQRKSCVVLKVSHYETARSASQQSIYQPKHNFAVKESAFVGDVRINLSTNSPAQRNETFAFSWTAKFWSLRCNNEVEWFAVFGARGCGNRVVDLFRAMRWETRAPKWIVGFWTKKKKSFELLRSNFHFNADIQ